MNKKILGSIIAIVYISLYVGCQTGFRSPVAVMDASLIDGNTDIPTEVILHPPCPNPTNGELSFYCEFPKRTSVYFAIENLAGDEVTVLWESEVTAGVHQITWSLLNGKGDRVNPGLYIAHLTTSDGDSVMQLFEVKDEPML